MGSNFLGEVKAARTPSSIISTAEMIEREGTEVKNSLNFRDRKDRLSVVLVLPREDGFRDEWLEGEQRYVVEGHDSVTSEGGKAKDQLLAYPSGALTENGKFVKAANEFEDGVRREPLQAQVYEKLSAGAWYDKSIFNLMQAKKEMRGGRQVFRFYFALADAEFYGAHDSDKAERMLPAQMKAEIWERCRGRCVECGVQMGLRMVEVRGCEMELRCTAHGGRRGSGLLG
jgi:hypothetical protein